MKAVILAGGYGTRIMEESQYRPKPLIEIGGRPILWHIMKMYSSHGVDDFILCCGYKASMVKEFFSSYALNMSDITFDLRSGTVEVHRQSMEPWRITIIDTGLDTMTGGRLGRVRDYIGDDTFALTYGDGVSDVNISAALQFHKQSGAKATVTGVQPKGRFGALDIQNQRVVSFLEKPRGDGSWVNGGFFILEPSVFDYIEGDSTVWEREPLEALAAEGELAVYLHKGFWGLHGYTSRQSLSRGPLGEWASAMEAVGLSQFWNDKRVLVTGHTGFKGSWLLLMLEKLGAEVVGYALAPEHPEWMFDFLKLESLCESHIGDLSDREGLSRLIANFEPDIVFHLAAQPLVRESYQSPVDTWKTNVMGTINLMEGLRALKQNCAVVMVTTDKVYENRNTGKPFVEDDRLGGFDPYSSSKAAMELAITSWKKSFFTDSFIAMASARAGNVIGGGDWAENRIVPDMARALGANCPVDVRSPQSVRPWQHVLEPLGGYLMLAQRLYSAKQANDSRCLDSLGGGINFGPPPDSQVSVERLVEETISLWPGTWKDCSAEKQFNEATLLSLDIAKAHQVLGWKPIWSLRETLRLTVEWYRCYFDHSPDDVHELSRKQVTHYLESLARLTNE